ncbi:MAG TPA: agmatine deiminase family protein [Gemmatimonadales bacterium]|jgi:agmatine deiminase|nr:agmatine deiminase family protein [Gemmatimonadales bacterium]
MPAEWAPHRGTWLSWPHKAASWPGKFEPVPGIFARIVAELVPNEEVHLNAGDAELEASARDILRRHGVPLQRVFFHRHPTDDAWCRDHGPIFVQRRGPAGAGEQLVLDWGYNAWGGKYPPFELDDAIPTRIAQELGLPVVAPGMVLEGGSIDVNGTGSLLTTEQCLLNANRNPGLSRPELEARLRDFLGVRKILWLGEGIEGDDTDGHIDDLTRFVSADTVVTAIEADPRDRNYAPLQDNLQRLRSMTDQDGNPLRIVELPMPPVLHHEGQRLPVSYANFYIANGVVLLPGFDPVRDAAARAVLQPLFPTRRIRVIDCTDLVWGLGAIHCVTQQWPAV